MTLQAGDVLFIPAAMIHAARNVGNVVEKGKPLVTLVK